jgi:CheY-like chemotaxis protein
MSKALIVDDDAVDRIRIAAVLRCCGFDCVEANDGVDALRFTSTRGIDLIITDMVMPRMDGLDLLAIISEGAFGARQLPTIICSEHLRDDKYRHRPELDLAAVKLAKPFTTAELMRAIATSLPRI